MSPKFHHLVLTILAVVCLCSAAVSVSVSVSAALSGGSGKEDALVGGWKTADPKDPEVVENAKFAVEEHNKAAKTELQFKSVIEAKEQVVSGTKYKLVIEALDGSASNNYEAVVWVKPWLKFRQLTSFTKLDRH